MRLFDTYTVVDWSAKSRPGPAHHAPPSRKKDNIWIGTCLATSEGRETYCRTRTEAREFLHAFLQEQVRQERKVLLGFDFAFGYPLGFARLLTGQSGWKKVWTFLDKALKDGPNNDNNRFALAAQMNASIEGPGPFWGVPSRQASDHLTTTSPWKGKNSLLFGQVELNRLRATDANTPGVQEVWKLLGIGSVGGQALTGIPTAMKLRNAPGIDVHTKIWPFETSKDMEQEAETRPLVVLAEVFPGLVEETVRQWQDETKDEMPRDQLQVRALAKRLAQEDAAGNLFNWFDSTGLPEAARLEEAAILKPT